MSYEPTVSLTIPEATGLSKTLIDLLEAGFITEAHFESANAAMVKLTDFLDAQGVPFPEG